jgi:hypothetical protein
MQKAILSSWCTVGLFPFDEMRILRKLKKFRPREQDQKDKELVDQVVALIEEKFAIQKNAQEEKKKRKKEAGKSILFQTTTTRILNSASSLSRRCISDEWQKCKNLKKKELVNRMQLKLGFTEKDVEKKTVPQLKELIQVKLLKDERELVKAFEKEVQSVTVTIPKEIMDLIYSEEKKEEKKEEEVLQQEPMKKKIRLHFTNLPLNE